MLPNRLRYDIQEFVIISTEVDGFGGGNPALRDWPWTYQG